MLRLLIGTGVLLMAVGFGAAGWQYLQTLPPGETGAAAASAQGGAALAAPAAALQSWLMSATGDVVSQDEVQAFLTQDRFVPSRSVEVTLQASLSDLLGEGETLPEAEYLQVLADIRAPRVAEGLCEVMLRSVASDCAVHAARVVEGSVDPVAGTAQFRLELVYRMPEPAEALPDLAAQVFRSAVVELPQGPEAPVSATAEAALVAALAAVGEACAAETVGDLCRMQRLILDWAPGQPARARAEIGWLDPLPNGMILAPPLTTAAGG
jgi:hypothetical protein